MIILTLYYDKYKPSILIFLFLSTYSSMIKASNTVTTTGTTMNRVFLFTLDLRLASGKHQVFEINYLIDLRKKTKILV